MTDNVGQAIFQMDHTGVVTFANPAAEAMFGWTQGEMHGRDLHAFIHHSHPDGRPFAAGDWTCVTHRDPRRVGSLPAPLGWKARKRYPPHGPRRIERKALR